VGFAPAFSPNSYGPCPCATWAAPACAWKSGRHPRKNRTWQYCRPPPPTCFARAQATRLGSDLGHHSNREVPKHHLRFMGKGPCPQVWWCHAHKGAEEATGMYRQSHRARLCPALLQAPLLPSPWEMPMLGSRAAAGAFPPWLPAWKTKPPTKARASGEEQL